MDTITFLDPQPGLPFPVRKEQTERQLNRLTASFDAWFVRRRQADQDDLGRYAGLHKTRLANLQSVLFSAAESLRSQLGQIDLSSSRDAGEVYDKCRAFDQALVWLERVFEFYRTKFDQRDDRDKLGPLLQAADEVIWSCYNLVFIQKSKLPDGLTQRPVAPLAYIATDYSPATWEADKLAPAELRPGATVEGLDEFLLTLPIPLLRLPPWCVDAPWWLIFVAHEVGHDILHDFKLGALFGQQVARAAQGQGLGDADRKRWVNTGEELFADLFSVAMMGRWAVRALVEVELTVEGRMLVPRGRYPASAVRLGLVADAADRLGLAGASALCGLALEAIAGATPAMAQDRKVARAIVDAVCGTGDKVKPGVDLTGNGGTLEVLAALSQVRAGLLPGGAAQATWGASLSGQPPKPTKNLLTPRLVVCGAVAAWERATALPDAAARQKALDGLATNTVNVLRASGPEGVRAKIVSPADLSSQGGALANLLLAAGRQPGPPTASKED